MNDKVILSTDTQRSQRLPPNQTLTQAWPTSHAGEIPPFDGNKWDLSLFPYPLIPEVKSFNWLQFQALPRVKVFADLHSVIGVSKLDNLWEGVPTRELWNHVRIKPSVQFVMVHGEYGFCTNMPIDDFFGEDCLFAMKHNGEDLTLEQGFPVRLVVPRLFDWKSAKWVRGIEFMEHDQPGFWEESQNGGFHMRGDPWTLDAHGDGQRYRKK